MVQGKVDPNTGLINLYFPFLQSYPHKSLFSWWFSNAYKQLFLKNLFQFFLDGDLVYNRCVHHHHWENNTFLDRVKKSSVMIIFTQYSRKIILLFWDNIVIIWKSAVNVIFTFLVGASIFCLSLLLKLLSFSCEILVCCIQWWTLKKLMSILIYCASWQFYHISVLGNSQPFFPQVLSCLNSLQTCILEL